MGLIDDGAGGHEQGVLGDGVEHRLIDGPLQGQGVEEHQPEDHIGDLAYRGVGQPFFQGILPQGQGGAHEHRNEGEHQHSGLGPGAVQEGPAEQVVHHPDQGQHPHLGDEAGQHRRGGGGRHRVGDGQPGVEGKHPRLAAEADGHDKEDRQQELPVLPRPEGVQPPPRGKQVGGAVALEDEQPQQTQPGSGHREAQISVGRVQGLPGADVEHQGDGEQGHHLVK